jgi:hypothetical protein
MTGHVALFLTSINKVRSPRSENVSDDDDIDQKGLEIIFASGSRLGKIIVILEVLKCPEQRGVYCVNS